MASASSSPCAGMALQAAGPVSGEGLGQAASRPSSPSVPEGSTPFATSTCTPDRRSGADGGRRQVAFASPLADSAPSPGHGDRVNVRGVTGGRSPDKFSREEVILFGGIPD